MTVHRGDIYGFVGKNGSGKTTLIRILSGLSQADSGSYTLLGVPNNSRNIIKIRRRTCAMVENPAVYPEMAAYDNMKMQCMILQKPFGIINEYLSLVGLPETGKCMNTIIYPSS